MSDNNINILNFRDLGGYPSKDGRYIKNSLLFRGSPLEDLNDDEKKYIDSLNLKRIIDFRSDDEIHLDKMYIPNNCIYSSHPFIFNDNGLDLDMIYGKNKDKFASWLKDLYRILPYNNDAYKVLFDSLIKEEYPLYFHCSAGKDRTGVAAALIMHLLDIDEKYIYEEYMISFENMMKFFEKQGVLETYLVDENWLLATFEEMDKRFEKREEYFYKEYGIDENIKNELKNKLLR